jgi:GntR family uxuAB operon transcriptional repressor
MIGETTMVDSKSTRLGSNEIAATLRREISNGDRAPRERLQPERELAEVYGVSRSTVRAALNRLAEEGLVEIKRGSGTYVAEASGSATQINMLVENARPLELIDARFALEPHLCRLAVLHARTTDIDEMENLIDSMDEHLTDPIEFSKADQAFHNLLAQSTGNSLLIWFNTQISAVRIQDEWSRMRQITLNSETMALYNKQHRQILEAIRTREPELAAARMKEHLETARLSLTRAAST